MVSSRLAANILEKMPTTRSAANFIAVPHILRVHDCRHSHNQRCHRRMEFCCNDWHEFMGSGMAEAFEKVFRGSLSSHDQTSGSAAFNGSQNSGFGDTEAILQRGQQNRVLGESSGCALQEFTGKGDILGD